MLLDHLKTPMIVSVTALVVTSAPASAWVVDNVTPDNFGPMEVFIDDMATNGCWTNIGEVRTYAEDKLAEAGFEVVDSSAGKFIIRVYSQRSGNDLCYGSIETSLGLAIHHNGMYSGLQVGNEGTIFSNFANANTLTLDMVKEQIEQLVEVQPDR
jgi:hypothetical protein